MLELASKSLVNVFGLSPVHGAALSSPQSGVIHWLARLGPLGLFGVAAIDSSGIPLLIPGSTDLLLLWMVSHHGSPWLMTPCAVCGSVLGGYIAWSAGSRGGEAVLRHHGLARFIEPFVGWAKRHTILSIFVPALMPPPVLVSPFVLVSGAIGVSRRRFLTVYGTARALRYGLVAWLGVVYGHSVTRMWNGLIQKWTMPLVCVFVAMLVCGVGLVVWQVVRGRKSRGAKESLAATAQAQ
jgi:membrane protein YqaA with SNARE-associated domain